VRVAIGEDDEPMDRVREVFAGDHHACALTMSDELWCWGDNTSFALGTSPLATRRAPFPFLQGVGDVALGAEHTCVRVPAGVQCWGANFGAQSAPGTSAVRLRGGTGF